MGCRILECRGGWNRVIELTGVRFGKIDRVNERVQGGIKSEWLK